MDKSSVFIKDTQRARVETHDIEQHASNAKVGHASCADHCRPTRTHRRGAKRIWVLITSTVRLCGEEKSKKFGVCDGVEDNIQDMNELQGRGELLWRLDTYKSAVASMQVGRFSKCGRIDTRVDIDRLIAR